MLKRRSLMVAVLCLQAGALLASEDTACRSDAARDRDVVRDYLLARGEFPDGLTITGAIKVELNGNLTQQVGRFFRFYPWIVDAGDQVLQGNEVEMLILSGGNSVVPFTLMLWGNEGEDDIDDAGSVSGIWVVDDWRAPWRLVLPNLFLTRDLPKCSRLAVLVRNKPRSSNKFRLQTFPFASRAAETPQLTEPVTYKVLESDPPRAKWTLKFDRNIASSTTITWYVASKYGKESAPTHFTTDKDSTELTIMSQPHRTWEGNYCMMLVVKIGGNPGPDCRGSPTNCTYAPHEIIAAPFAGCRI